MYLISHRGNISGKNIEKENSPGYIEHALSLGYDVEIDIWFIDNNYYFGHDNPDYIVSKDFINQIKDRSWFHCKNKEALSMLNKNFDDINFFWHETDKYTLTSKGYVWVFPGEDVIKNSIILFPENYPEDKNKILLSSGICSDYIQNYDIYKNIQKIEHNEFEIILKLKNPIYNFYTHSKEFRLFGNGDVKNFDGLTLANTRLGVNSDNINYGHIFPIVIDFNLNINKNNSIEYESVFLYQFTARYFHNVVELFPKLIKLKQIDPNFVFIFVYWFDPSICNQALNVDKNLSKDNYYDYLIEFLDLLNIEYKFLLENELNEICFKNSYIFYEKYDKKIDGFEKYWHDALSIYGYSHCHTFYSTDQYYIINQLKNISNYINNFDHKLNLKQNNSCYPEKIFISRKNFYSRKNYNLIISNDKSQEINLEKIFEQNGYHVVNMEDYNFLEQIKISHNADIIACYVGSSIFNAFYSTKNVKVFYLNPINEDFNNEPHLKIFYKHILDDLGIKNNSYDIDMYSKDYTELENILNTL